jgi:hypothetical protein
MPLAREKSMLRAREGFFIFAARTGRVGLVQASLDGSHECASRKRAHPCHVRLKEL